VIIDESGAERLLGRGDLIACLKRDKLRLQVPLAGGRQESPDDEVEDEPLEPREPRAASDEDSDDDFPDVPLPGRSRRRESTPRSRDER
jgi:hypothetical protein